MSDYSEEQIPEDLVMGDYPVDSQSKRALNQASIESTLTNSINLLNWENQGHYDLPERGLGFWWATDYDIESDIHSIYVVDTVGRSRFKEKDKSTEDMAKLGFFKGLDTEAEKNRASYTLHHRYHLTPFWEGLRDISGGIVSGGKGNPINNRGRFRDRHEVYYGMEAFQNAKDGYLPDSEEIEEIDWSLPDRVANFYRSLTGSG